MTEAMSDRGLYQVVFAHQASCSYILKARAGEKVTISDKKEEGWVWCTKEALSAWIPEKYLKQGKHIGTMLVDYDSTELTVTVGERLTLIREESGWIWCSNQNRQRGWVPLSKIKKV